MSHLGDATGSRYSCTVLSPCIYTLSLKLSCSGLTLLLAMKMVLSPKEDECVACNLS